MEKGQDQIEAHLVKDIIKDAHIFEADVAAKPEGRRNSPRVAELLLQKLHHGLERVEVLASVWADHVQDGRPGSSKREKNEFLSKKKMKKK